MHARTSIPIALEAIGRGSTDVRPGLILAILCTASAMYGAVMGSWEVHLGDRWLLMLFGAAKMPLLVIGTTLVCLPGFFVLNSVAGLRDDFAAAMRAIMGAQAAFAAALLSLAPVTRFMYTWGLDQSDAILANAAMFTLATILAQSVLFRAYRALRAKSPTHRYLLWVWLVMYAFVGTQMGWMLRPFIGKLDAPPTFLREEPFSNAYVVVFRLIAGKLGFM
jgi:hypothetical protein